MCVCVWVGGYPLYGKNLLSIFDGFPKLLTVVFKIPIVLFVERNHQARPNTSHVSNTKGALDLFGLIGDGVQYLTMQFLKLKSLFQKHMKYSWLRRTYNISPYNVLWISVSTC